MARKTLSKTRFVPETSKRFTSVLLIAVAIVAAIAGGSFVYVFANPGTTMYVEEGLYPGAPSYTVWNEESTYYAKDANGHIDFVSSNATDLIQDCLDSFPISGTGVGGLVHLCAGNYTIDTEIVIEGWDKHIEGEGMQNTKIITSSGVAYGAFYMNGQTNMVYRSSIRNLMIDGTSTQTIAGINQTGTFGCWIENVRITMFNGTNGAGVYCRTKATLGNFDNIYENLQISHCQTGVKITGDSGGYHNNGLFFHGGYIQYCLVGFDISKSKMGTVQCMDIEGNPMHTGFLVGYSPAEQYINDWRFEGVWIETPVANNIAFNLSTHTNYCWIQSSHLASSIVTKVGGAGYADGCTNLFIDNANDFNNIRLVYGSSRQVTLTTYNGPGRLEVDASFTPDTDSTYYCGWGSYRWRFMAVASYHPDGDLTASMTAGTFWFCLNHTQFEYWDGDSIEVFDHTPYAP